MTSSITVYAVWTPAPTPPLESDTESKPDPALTPEPTPTSTPVPPPGVVIPDPAPEQPVIDAPVLEPDATPDEVHQALKDESYPSIAVGDMDVPRVAGPLQSLVWALFNLILAAAGLILGVVAVTRAASRKKREENGSEEERDAYETEEETQKRKRIRLVWLITAIIMAAAGIVVFLITEDMSRLMALMDNWTIVNLIIFAAELIGIRLAFRRKTAPTPPSLRGA
jgi:hypothetical protein